MRAVRGSFISLVVVVVLAIPVSGLALPQLDDSDGYTIGDDWPAPETLTPGDHGPWVQELQRRLNDAGFRAGEPDGRFGPATLAAVYGFEKVFQLERDGVFSAGDWVLLDSGIPNPGSGGEDDRVEIDLGKQVLYLIQDGDVTVVVPISSANGDSYRSYSGGFARATTPEGAYSFYRQVDGWRISYLGGLYRPFYFTGGYALHGSGSVPPYPASHGCIRVELWDMDYLATQLELGMPLYVYGNRIDRTTLLLPQPVDLTPPGWQASGGSL